MTPVLNIDASNPQFTLIGIADADDPGNAGYTFVKLVMGSSPLEGPWYKYDQSTDKVEALNENVDLPMQLLLMAYYAGKTAANTSKTAQNTSVPGFTKVVGTQQVSHLASSPTILQAIGQKALAYHAATTTGAPPTAGPPSQQAPNQVAQAIKAANIMQMLKGMPKLASVQESLLDYPIEPAEQPVQAEQDSIDQLDRELAGLDEFLNDVRAGAHGRRVVSLLTRPVYKFSTDGWADVQCEEGHFVSADFGQTWSTRTTSGDMPMPANPFSDALQNLVSRWDALVDLAQQQFERAAELWDAILKQSCDWPTTFGAIAQAWDEHMLEREELDAMMAYYGFKARPPVQFAFSELTRIRVNAAGSPIYCFGKLGENWYQLQSTEDERRAPTTRAGLFALRGEVTFDQLDAEIALLEEQL